MKLFCTEKDFFIEAETADTFLARFRGLMFRKSLREGTGLFLEGCGSIHMFFMRFPIRAVYLDGNCRVLRTEVLRPWRIGSIVKGTRHVLELRVQDGMTLSEGDRLRKTVDVT